MKSSTKLPRGQRFDLSILLCLLSVALSGCLDAVVGDADVCKVDGKSYALNESFPSSDGCNTCTCQLDGSAACTEKACLNDGGAAGNDGGKGCSYGGNAWQVGDIFSATDGCNTCSCLAGGQVGCSLKACGGGCTDGVNIYAPGDEYVPANGCGTCICRSDGEPACLVDACTGDADCTYEGKYYDRGQTFPSSDGCNTCSCGANGEIACTLLACNPGTCSYGGKTYKAGDTFSDALDCNGCSCAADGTVACTARYCDPAQACSKGDSKFASGNSVICDDGCNTCSCNNTAWSTTDIACGALQKVESCSGQLGVEKVRVLYRDGDKLAVEVGTGGCANEQPAFRLCFDGQYRESFPVQVTLNLIPTTISACSAWVTQQKVFDLSPLRTAYQQAYQTQSATISVSLDNTGFLYTF